MLLALKIVKALVRRQIEQNLTLIKVIFYHTVMQVIENSLC